VTLLDFLLPSKARQGLVAALLRERVRGSMSDLARRAGVTPAAAKKEVDQMLAAGLVVSERDGRRKMVRANDRSPQVRALRRLLDHLDGETDSGARESDELVRAWLGHYGAPLLVSAHLPASKVPSFEETFAHGLGLAHRDATVAEVLPLVLWNHRNDLDLAELVRLATKQDEAQALGLFLDLTAALGRHRAFARAAETLRDGRYRRMKYFFTADGRTELSREVARMHTPKLARRWHFFMNMPFEGFESHFRKFTRAESIHS
jgi:DNA-binding MarR family transcriptional regulator